MAYITCVVASCKTRRRPNTDKSDAVKCFSFPKDPELKKEWMQRCQVLELDQVKDFNKKVCIKHFKEDDFVDGLKARLMNLQPRILKKNATPSLYLNSEKQEIPNKKNTEQSIMTEKLLDDIKKDNTKKVTNVTYKEYLSKLVPIAPKGAIVATGDKIDYNELYELKDKNKIKKETVVERELRILRNDNKIFKKKITLLLKTQEMLKAHIKDLDKEIKAHNRSFIVKVKEAFAEVLTPNQIDVVLQKKARVWWTEMEYTKAYTLLHLSKIAYFYMRDTFHYPLPGYSSLQQWAAKINPKTETADIDTLPKNYIILNLDKVKPDIQDGDTKDLIEDTDFKNNPLSDSTYSLQLKSENFLNNTSGTEDTYNITDEYVTKIDPECRELYEIVQDCKNIDQQGNNTDEQYHDNFKMELEIENYSGQYEEMVIENFVEQDIIDDTFTQGTTLVIEEENG